ncbi:unnamed protein product [Closterium sp. NIES-53]
MYGGWKKQPETKVSQQMEQITMQLDLTPSVWEEGEEAAAEGGDEEKVQEARAGGGDDVETSGSTKEAAGSEGAEQQLGKAKVPALLSRRKPKGVSIGGWKTPVSRPGRTRMATMKLTTGADVAEQQLGNEEALLILPHGYDPDEEDEPAYCFLAPAPEEPASMEEALAGPDSEKWLVSRDAEYQSLLENGTWDLVVLPEGKKAVQCKWVLRIKTDDKGQVTIYKSRLVAKGFMQKEKQDFNEIFGKPPTLRSLFLAFKGADGKPVVLHDVLLVPDLKANLISLRKLAKAGVSTSTDGERTYKGQLGNRVLWDLHESKDVYRSMWQLPALAWHGGGQAGEGSASQGGCNAVGGVGVKVSARSGEMDWATAHRRLGHSIYGLKRAPHCWCQNVAAVLEEMGFRTSSYDESLVLKGEEEKLVLFLVYVNDILFFSSSMKEIQNVQQQLMDNFKCKNLGEAKYYKRMPVKRDPDHMWLKLHQEKFIKELGEKYRIENERKVATPLPAEFKLVKAEEQQ